MANQTTTTQQQQADEFSNWEVLNQSDFELSSDDDDVKSFDSSFSFASSSSSVGVEKGEREEPTKDLDLEHEDDGISGVLEDAEKMWQGYLMRTFYDDVGDDDDEEDDEYEDDDDDVMGTSPPPEHKDMNFIDVLVDGSYRHELYDDGVMGKYKYDVFKGHYVVDQSCEHEKVHDDVVCDGDHVACRDDDGGYVDGEGDESDDGEDDGYDVDDELVPWEFKGKLGKERMRKLGKRGYSKLGKTKRSSLLFNKPGCVRGKHGLGLKAY